MDSEKWKQVKSIFNEASELPKDERPLFLARFSDETRLEVEKMLKAIEEESRLLNEPIVDFRDFENAQVPEKIGDYKIIREVGHGGMGTVYEAFRETENFKQRVALKVIKRGMNNEIILKRFRSEQQILATLEHPNIGRFLDGGKTADGLPFYAMEFIEGVSIDEYCRSLSVEEKIRIFRDVCSAVSYAHTNLIVHRDLKPSNIIVTENGTPKLLDFGIAKVLDIDSKEVGTATQLGMMTPRYASPEQIRGEKVTTLSDVYSLGVIFYEILTNSKPYELEHKNYAEILKIITKTTLTKPSENQRSKIKDQGSKIKGDLDNIVLKSLQKSPERRYQSVEQFSEDLRRHIVGLPITARPDTFQYRLSKFVERNKIGVTAGVLVFLSLLTGIGVASWQAYRAEKQRLLAEKRFAEVRSIANNLVYKYTDEISALPNSMRVRAQLLQDGSNYLDQLAEDSAGDFLLQNELAQAYIKLGDLKGKPHSNSLGDTAGAIESYEKASVLLENVYQNSPSGEKIGSALALVKIYRQIGAAFSRANFDAEKRKANNEKIRVIIEEISTKFPNSLEFKIESARLKLSEANRLLKKNFDEGEILFDKTILPTVSEIEKNADADAASRSFASKVYDDLMWNFWERAKLLRQVDENSERAKQIFARAYDFASRSEKFKENDFSQNPTNIGNKRGMMVGYVNVGISLYLLERFDESLNYLNKGNALAREVSEFDPLNIQAFFDIGSVASEFGIFHDKKRDYQTALKFYEKSIAAFDRVISKDSKHHEAIYYKIEVLLQTAETLFKTGNLPTGLEYCRLAEDLWQKHYSADNDDQNQLGRIYLISGKILGKLGENKKAQTELQKALEIMKKSEIDNNRLFVQIIERELNLL